MAFSTPDPLDDLFRKLQRGELSRRAFMRRAAALGIAAPAAAFMARAAGVTAQDATPGAGASPVAGGGGPLALAEIENNPGSEQPDADPEATLTINLGQEIDTGDPQVLAFLNEIEISSKVYVPLLALNEENLPAGAGAESVTVSADGTVYTFTIREGMTYSDGEPVTAHNYAYAIKRALSPVVAGNYSNTLYAVKGGQAWREADPAGDTADLEAVVSESIKALDDRTLQITLDYAAGYFPYVMAIWVTYPVREDLVEGNGADWWRDIANYVGNGPFKVTTHTEGQEWVFERNESYFRGSPGIKTLVFKEIDSSETELLSYQAGGEGDFDIMGPAASQLPQIMADPTLSEQLQRGVGASTNWFAMNNAAEPFTELKVRQAIAFALNRQQYVDQITAGVGIPAGTLLYPGNPAYQEDYQQSYDPEKAKALLEEAGFPGGKDFPPQELFYIADDVSSQQQATFFSQNLSDVLGIQIQPTPIDGTELQSLRTNRDPSLIFSTGNWFEDYPHPQNWLSLVFGPGTTRAPLGWDDAHFNELVTKADQLPIEEAIPLYKEADAYLAEQAPVAFYRHGENLILIKPNVKGYVSYPTSIFDTTYQAEKIYKTAE